MKNNLTPADKQNLSTRTYSKEWGQLEEGDKNHWKHLYRTGFEYVEKKLGKDASMDEVRGVFQNAYDRFVDQVFPQIEEEEKEKKEIDTRYAPEAYLKGIVKYKCLEFWRKKRMSPPRAPNQDEEDEESRDLLERIAMDCFHELSQDCQRVLTLTIFEEKPHKEVAQEMGLSENYIKVRKNRCMNYLKDCMRRHNLKI